MLKILIPALLLAAGAPAPTPAPAALLADTRDGKPLPANEAPLRLVVPDEKRPARWVRQVIHITVGPVCPQK